MNRILSNVALLALAGTQLAAPSPAIARGNCSWALGSYLNGFMPDFDQKRQPGPLFWDGMNFIPIPDGLPGNGSNYCSPTSHVNVTAYLANHGFPALMPGGSATSWQSPSNYERVTDAIQEMGVLMQTSPTAGTTCCGHSGFVEYLDTYAPNKFIVTSVTANAFYAPTIGDLAFCALAGGFVNLMIGWFENTDINQWQKTGGHVVTMVGLEGWCGGTRQVTIRDPGNGNTSLMAQSAFANNTYTLQQLPGFFDSDGTAGLDVYLQRTYERMLNYNTSDGRIGLINGYRVVVPKYAVTLTPPPIQQLGFLNPIRPTHSTIPAQQAYAVPQFAQIADFAVSPDGFSVICLGRDSAGAPDPRAVIVNRATGDTTELTIGGAPIKVERSRGGDRSFFVDETGVLRFMGPSPQGPQVITVTPQDPVDLIAYDDPTDTLVCLSIAARKFHFFEPDGTPASPSLPVPSAIAFNGEVFMCSSPHDSAIWLRSQYSASIHKVSFDRILGAVIEETANIPASVGDIGIDVSVAQTREHILLARQTGVIAEYVKNTAGQWGPAPTSDFAGLPAHGGIRLARSRSAFDPEMEGPNDQDHLPASTSTPEWDCQGDVDLDGDVDFTDITAVLTQWADSAETPADTDGSGTVGFSDITTILTNWGPCQ